MSAFTSAAAKEAASVAITNQGSWISLHTASPGITGASEATGGAPAYARKQTVWTAGASDGVVNGSEVIIDVPAGTYTHFGIWSLAAAGTYVDGGTIPATTLAAQGQIKVTPSHTQS